MKWITGIAVTCILLLLLVLYPDIMISPGELMEGHQDQRHKCLSCHQPFGGVDNNRCISCHTLAEIGKDSTGMIDKVLFHEGLAQQSCSACHTDHAGTNTESSLSGFDHLLLDEVIINDCVRCHSQPTDTLHRQVSSTCQNCHDFKAWKPLASFDHTYLLPDRQNKCASCHTAPDDEYHQQIQDNCDKCHNTTKWVPSTFAHNDFFILDSDHNAKCNVCHKSNNYSEYTCYGCHEHTASGMIAEHSEEGITNITDCVSCHKSADEDGAERNMKNRNGGNQNGQQDGNNNEEDDD